MIYLDYAATTPMSEEALNAYTQTAKNFFGNTESLHNIGTKAHDLVEYARRELAGCFGGTSEGITFTSGGSEGNFLAITSLVRGYQHKGRHIISTHLEHSSVKHTLGYLQDQGFDVTYINVGSDGRVSLSEVRKHLREDSILVTIHHGNSEIGTIQPLEEIGRFLKEQGILFHSDCVQTFGKIPLDVRKMNLDAITLSAHKIYGPKGVGALYISPERSSRPFLSGVTHEKGMRPGTLNTPGIVSFVTAAQSMVAKMKEWQTHVEKLRSYFLSRIMDRDELFFYEGHNDYSLPHYIPIRIIGMEGQLAMLELNRRQIAVSTGSACQVGKQNPSPSLLAIGRTPDEARELIRMTLGWQTTKEDIEVVTQAFQDIAQSYLAKRS
ncbi:IscS subfamily cysteine desulfurase [Fictibacillus sp. Mic-4]|uniref:IscS subfamily cysteine desulfurase n=1 Tax=Fictibacillus sp. Mic-4 TaxID=3132826 RepID=UPI003CE999C2